jgi:tetratricopeptide (TPR) repeat protein
VGESQSSTAEFLKDVGKDVAVALALATLAGSAMLFGLTDRAELDSLDNWPLLAAGFGCVVLLLLAGRGLRIIARRQSHAAAGRASGERIAILLPRLVGDDADGTKRETIRERIRGELGNAVELLLWPETLKISEGRDDEAEQRALDQGRQWLAATGCDVVIWGRVRGDRVLSLRIGGGAHHPYVLDENTLDLPEEFNAELTRMIVEQALTEGTSAADEGRANLGQIRKVVTRIEAMLERIESHEMVLAYAALLTRLGQFLDDRAISARAIEMAIRIVKEEASRLSPETLFRANSSIASMFLGLSHQTLSRTFLDSALDYLEEARRLSPVSGGDLNYGILMSMLGKREMRADFVERALREFGDILSAEDGLHDEVVIGKAWHNMGMAYETLFLLTSDRSRLDASIAALETALDFRPRSDVPIYWAKTRDALGSAFLQRAKLDASPEDARESFNHCSAAREVYRQEALAQREAESTYNVGCALSAVGALDDDPTQLLAAVEELKAAEEYWAEEGDAHLMNVRNALGGVYSNLAIQSQDPEFAAMGAESFAASMALLDKDENREEWLGVSNNIARCHLVEGVLTMDPVLMHKAREVLEECASGVAPFGQHELAGMIRRNLEECYLKLSVMEEDNGYIDKAISLHENALKGVSAEADLHSWAGEMVALATLLMIRAQLTGSTRDADAAVEKAQSAARSIGASMNQAAWSHELLTAERVLEEATAVQSSLVADIRADHA